MTVSSYRNVRMAIAMNLIKQTNKGEKKMKKIIVVSIVFFVALFMNASVQKALALEEVVETTKTVASVLKTEDMVLAAENVVIFFDTSGSMGDAYDDSGVSKLAVAKQMLLHRASRFPDVFPQLNVGLYTYTPPLSSAPDADNIMEVEDVRAFYEMGPFDKTAFIAAVNSLPNQASGPTLMHNALNYLDKLLPTLSGRTTVILFTDGSYTSAGGDKKPVDIAQELAAKYPVSFHIASTATEENNIKLLDAVASINTSSRVYPMKMLLDYPETYTGAIFVIEESYIVTAEIRKEVVGLKLDHILFDYDGTGIKMEFNAELEAAGKVLKENPNSYIVLAGFTDSKGSEEYNLALSKRRVEAVGGYLTDVFEIDRSRVLLFWYGEAAPIADNETEEGRQKNRRVIGCIAGVN
jgi:OmpA-OmpF porin, OOP family